MNRRIVFFVGIIFLTFGLVQCGKIADEPASGTFGSVYKALKNNSCQECHVPTGSATVTSHVELDFTSQTTAYTTLINGTVKGSTSVGTCSGVKLVVPSSPSTSYLAAVLFSSYSHDDFGKTGCTPYSTHNSVDTHVTSTEQKSIIDWISNGAQND